MLITFFSCVFFSIKCYISYNYHDFFVSYQLGCFCCILLVLRILVQMFFIALVNPFILPFNNDHVCCWRLIMMLQFFFVFFFFIFLSLNFSCFYSLFHNTQLLFLVLRVIKSKYFSQILFVYYTTLYSYLKGGSWKHCVSCLLVCISISILLFFLF